MSRINKCNDILKLVEVTNINGDNIDEVSERINDKKIYML